MALKSGRSRRELASVRISSKVSRTRLASKSQNDKLAELMADDVGNHSDSADRGQSSRWNEREPEQLLRAHFVQHEKDGRERGKAEKKQPLGKS